MKIEKLLSVSFMILLMFSGSIFAQKSDEDQIRDLIINFTKTAEQLRTEGAKKADALVAYVGPDFKYESKSINVMNLIDHEQMDLKMVKAMLGQVKASSLTMNRALGPLDDVHVRDKVGLARYYNEYELVDSDRLISKGIQYVELILRKHDSGWKISWFTSLEIDDKEYKGTCLCEIYENNGLKNIITETIVPDGSSVDLQKDKFEIISDQEPKLVRHDFREYFWYQNGAIHRRNFDGTKGDALGAAKSRQELLLNLLRLEVYPDRCFNVVRKLR